MSTIRYSVDPKATVRLRFDDDEFLAALEADAARDGHPLAGLLGVEVAAEADLSGFVDDGTYLDARLGITGAESDTLLNIAQQESRVGSRVDVAAYNCRWFATWVRAVGDNAEPSDVPKGLASTDRRQREEAYGALPLVVRGALAARLRVHVDEASKPAMRDPKPSRPPASD